MYCACRQLHLRVRNAHFILFSALWQQLGSSQGQLSDTFVKFKYLSKLSLFNQVVLSDTPEDRTLGLYLEDVPLIAPGAPVTRRLLEEFNTNSVEGFVLELTPAELTRLDTGVVHFDIKDLHTSKSLLRAHWKQVWKLYYKWVFFM